MQDTLIYNTKNDPVFDAVLKGKIQSFDAVLMLVDYLYSITVKDPSKGAETEPEE